MATPRRKAVLAAKLLVLAAVLWFAGKSVYASWSQVEDAARGLAPSWGLLVVSGLVVFAAYLLLVEAWRRLMSDWGSRVSYGISAQIWFVSVLGRYIPGRIWSAIAVGVMAQRLGASPAIAVGSALLLTLINTVVGGCLLLALGGPDLLQQIFEYWGLQYTSSLTVLLALAPLALILFLPMLLPTLASAVGRITGRAFNLPRLTSLSILRSAAACAGAWLLYGIAFWLFYRGLFGAAPGSAMDYVKVYTGSYLVGYVTVVAPGGIVAREFAMQTMLPWFALAADEGQAIVAAWYSRIWLTVLEVLPGVALMVGSSLARRRDPNPSTGGIPDDDTNTVLIEK